MPREDGVRGDDRRDLREELPSERLTLRGKPATLVIRQSEAATTRVELLLENAVLLDQVDDRRSLPSAHPRRERGEEELERKVEIQGSSLAPEP